MSTSGSKIEPYQAAWNQLVIELRSFFSEIQAWTQGLSMGEKVIGLCLFALILMFLIVTMARKKTDPGSNGRQFTGALVLVVIFAFGTGWSLDTSSGSLSHLFGR